jgi:hypothetical protein
MRLFSRLVLVFAVTQSVFAAVPAKDQTFDASVPRERQIALAMEAAPAEITENATVYILGKTGYEVAKTGTNGFSCLVDREFVTTMEPECYDAEGSATTLKTRLRTEELRAQGKSEEDIQRDIEQGYKEGRFKAPDKPGVVYMLSDKNRVYDPSSKQIINFPGHLMFYAPYMTDKDLGYKSQASLPYLVHPGRPDALMIVAPAQSAAHDH